MRGVLDLSKAFARAVMLIILVACGTVVLMRFAPGYFTNELEMDARYAHQAEAQLHAEQLQQSSLVMAASATFHGWLHGDLGRSREYDIPVLELLRPRLGISVLLLARGLAYGWLLAVCAAVAASSGRIWVLPFHAVFTLLLAIPIAAMATLCLRAETGGSVLVLALLLAARDFKLTSRMLRAALKAPYLLQVRAQGVRRHRMLRVHLLPSVLPQLIVLAALSIVTALSALVPVEVIFDVPGVGQLAWAAAMNRDLPVLVAITLLMASVMAGTSMFLQHRRTGLLS